MRPDLPIVHEDEHLVAFDKPAGFAVGRGPGLRGAGNLADIVRERWGAAAAVVHRLDDEASGLVLCAKTKVALDALSGQFQSKTATVTYEALTSGCPPVEAASIDLSLQENPEDPRRMATVKRHGYAASTDYRVQNRFARFAQIECRPRTFRRHQVRVHLAAIGAPILGDALYGNGAELRLSDLKRGYKGREEERPLIDRLALHAIALTVRHPASGLPLTINAPLPKDFTVALRNLEKFGK
ncbi:MAG TPA: pseudouridine synthase [Candidatus Didemnitutus sp.]|nr:pseudouridine synthase [Candidatus Didemnitutus sp.]